MREMITNIESLIKLPTRYWCTLDHSTVGGTLFIDGSLVHFSIKRGQQVVYGILRDRCEGKQSIFKHTVISAIEKVVNVFRDVWVFMIFEQEKHYSFFYPLHDVKTSLKKE